ncbi:M23 family metallopeptidase [Stenotrophomonas mori]|uniref:M23 family metallopeptidase n=1 Tax=Stenotrophomonas mori TaxID=2871096 RepID=A0ABT0SLD4_9GAMM|nr:M23 family metallopeptidase [Stenotrophomonas mori]MCL7715729.1 M23 family metallopeptidase [Stenotrophomonas mori]
MKLLSTPPPAARRRLRGAWLLLAATLMPGLPAAGGEPEPRWRQGWGLSGAPPAAADDDGRFAVLRLQPRAGGHEVQVRNRLAGPLQVRLRHGGDGGTASTAVVLRGGEQRRLAWLPGDGPARALLLDAFPGAPMAAAPAHRYRLAFDAVPVRVSQGIGGQHSHNDAQNRYAIDFPLPEGTPILAARAGTVMQVAGSRDDGTLVRILHGDGSMALYAHLLPGTPEVRPGQRVQAGQRLALSGNSGRSSGPHLHFAVQINAGLALVSVPFRMAGPRGELHFPREAAGPPPAL